MSCGRRPFLVLPYLAVFGLACEDSSDNQAAAGNNASTTVHSSSTAGSSSTDTHTATATTATATTATTLATSTSTTTANSNASSAGSGSTNGSGGAFSATSNTSLSASSDSGGAAGAPHASTGTAGSDGGVLVLQDVCGHQACGGSLPNTDWQHVRACVQTDALIGPIQSFCPSITLVSSSGELTGTIAFEDGSFNQDVSFSLSIELDVPADCDITCTGFASLLAVMGFPEGSCEESNGGCRCVGTARGADPRSGDYTTHDSTLTLSLPYGDIEASYCADESSLSYVLPVMLVPQGTPMDVVYETVPQ